MRGMIENMRLEVQNRMFKVKHKIYEYMIFTVYKINKSGTMFLVYNEGNWEWIYSNDYMPV